MTSQTEICTVADIVDALGGPAKVGEICGFEANPSARGSDMRRRGSINSKHWPKIIAAARKESLAITYETLVSAHATETSA